ncbi:TolC family protein [Plastoroseomonas arctica]|uniref:TolC family protein n=1 Tax=Plastoroseomonas arctica TaxID=1509237 RepID=A0AAF1JWQ1_9PROT|nr:TolC family protein [Plastoroseomonas arctica]MBR0655444.1 TolC family protein [Plastoroseomonas arctica]
MRLAPLSLLASAMLAAPLAPAHAQQSRPRGTNAAQARPVTPATSPGITLAEAESLLVARNLTVIAARRGVDIAAAQRLVADTNPAGSVGYGQTTAQVNERQRFSGYTGARYISPLNNLSFSLTVTIERGGKRELRTRLAEEQISVAEAQVLDAMREQIFALRTAFIQGLQARANLQVALANRESLGRTESLLSLQVREGAIPEADLLRFQASRLPFEQDVANAIQAYAASVAQVTALLGADASLPRAAPGASFELRGRLEGERPLDIPRGTLAAAIATRPDVLAAQRTASAANANTRLAEAGRSRDVSLGGSASRTELSQDLPSGSTTPRATNTLGLSLSVPIFTRRITEGNIAVAQAQQSQAQAQADGALAQAQSDFAIAWASYEQARSLLALTTGTALRRAEDAYRATEAAYLAGGRSLLDTLDALRTLNATRVAANAARAAYATALVTLERTSGVDGLAPRLQP